VHANGLKKQELILRPLLACWASGLTQRSHFWWAYKPYILSSRVVVSTYLYKFLLLSYLSLGRTEKPYWNASLWNRLSRLEGWKTEKLGFDFRWKRVHIVSAARPENEAKHLLPNRAVITNEWSYSYAPRRHLPSVYWDKFIFIVFIFFICLFILVHPLISVKVGDNITIINTLSCYLIKF
jgi:hypothetical protein